MFSLLITIGLAFVLLMILLYWIGDKLDAPIWFWRVYGVIFGAPIGGCLAQLITYILEEVF